MVITSKFRLAPEWTRQSALWVGWPHLRDEWGAAFTPAQDEIAAFAKTASRFVPLKLACGSQAGAQAARAKLGGIGAISIEHIPCGDIWLRDTGPVFSGRGGDLAALTFRFNGWGEKYVMPGDTDTALALAEQEGAPVEPHDFVLEGGAIDLDGAGRLLTTRECLLNPNRNSDWSKADAEAALRSAFGVDEIVWLTRGLINDHTDGHVDNIARFIGPGHVVCQAASGGDDPNAAIFGEVEAGLRRARLTVSTVPSPGRIEAANGDVAPASHMNFVFAGSALIVPIYEPVFSAQAGARFASLFPDREVILLPARHILAGGGAFHCMTREIPALPIG
ncbi:MAG: agmatine deiminase family protein [Pseudomonadota bacterium]